MASDLRIPARNITTMMVYAATGSSASLHTSVSHVVDHILIPGVLEGEKINQRIAVANSRRSSSCMVCTANKVIKVQQYASIQQAIKSLITTALESFHHRTPSCNVTL